MKGGHGRARRPKSPILVQHLVSRGALEWSGTRCKLNMQKRSQKQLEARGEAMRGCPAQRVQHRKANSSVLR